MKFVNLLSGLVLC